MNNQVLCGRSNTKSSRSAFSARKLSKSGDLQRLKQTPSGCRTNRQGAAVVEFAVVAPLLFLLVFGMLEYGRLIMVQQIITNASREGSRQAVLEGATTSGVQGAVNSYLSNASINSATVAVSPDPATASTATPMTVTVTVNYDNVRWLPTSIYLGGRTLSASSTMRRESSY